MRSKSSGVHAINNMQDDFAVSYNQQFKIKIKPTFFHWSFLYELETTKIDIQKILNLMESVPYHCEHRFQTY